jgi:protein subunit release factor A
MGKIIGKWPGDETDEEIQAAMDAMDPVKQLREEIKEYRNLLSHCLPHVMREMLYQKSIDENIEEIRTLVVRVQAALLPMAGGE